MDKERSAYTNPAGGELARIGRILMDKAATTKDDALSNVLGRVGDQLTMYGDSGGAQSMEELVKRTNVKKEHLMKLIKWAKEQTDTSHLKVKDPTDSPEDDKVKEFNLSPFKKKVMNKITQPSKDYKEKMAADKSEEEIGSIKDRHNKKKESIETESTPIGHTDDERNMIRKELYQMAKYAKEMFEMLEDLPADSDFPHWWQAKVVNSLSMISKAKHYLENELNVPDVDGDRTEEAVCAECNKPRFVALPEEMQKQYHSVNEEKQKGVDGKVCWKGYKRMGTKMKGGKRVDNCVKM